MDGTSKVNGNSSTESHRNRFTMTPVKSSIDTTLPNLAAVSTPEQIEKAFSAFGNILSQRKTELSEMKRANQSRLNEELRLRVSHYGLHAPSDCARTYRPTQSTPFLKPW